MAESEFRIWAGVDLGSEVHQVCVLDAAGEVLDQCRVPHEAAELEGLAERLRGHAGGDAATAAVALETPASAVAEVLLALGFAVFSINPKQLDRFRDRFSPSGAKDDRRDARVLATSLRTDAGCFRRLAAEDPAASQLRALTRMRQVFKADLAAYANRLRILLQESWPELLALCPAADEAWLWELLSWGPCPLGTSRPSLSRLAALLRRRRIRRMDAAELQQRLRRPALPLPAASLRLRARQIATLLPLLQALRQQRIGIDAQIAAAFAPLAEETEAHPGQYRDAQILLSLPGVGVTVAATMLAEAHEAIQARDYYALRAHAGVAPVTRQSGKTCLAMMRRACNHPLRDAIYHWCRVSMVCEPRSREHYRQLRARGHSHGRALRGLADRLLQLLCTLLRRGCLYDPARRRPPAAALAGQPQAALLPA